MNEQDALSDWLVSYLEADTTLMGMCNGQVAPEVIWGTNPSPFVKFDFLDGEDLMVIGLHRVWLDSTWHIRAAQHYKPASGQPNRTVINAIGNRLDQLLHDHEETTSLLHFCCFRVEPSPTPSVVEPDGSAWLCSGGIYRFLASAL